jgi:hypothetical protein
VKELLDIRFGGFSKILDKKAVSSGNLTRNVLKQTIRELLAEAGVGDVAVPVVSADIPQDNAVIAAKVHYCANNFHFLPVDFESPSTDPLTAWKLWWFGNAALGYPPLRYIPSRDLLSRQKASTLSEWSMLMTHITAEVEKDCGQQ